MGDRRRVPSPGGEGRGEGDLIHKPYWWEAGPRPELAPQELPKAADIVIVGSGYTGLCAALTLARAGRGVLVLDREAAGWGASSRNQGHVGASFRRGFQELAGAYGETRAVRVFEEGLAAVEHTKALIEAEGIDCRLETRGRVIAAWSPAHYEALARQIELRCRRTGLEAEIVPKERVRDHIGSERYCGGVLMRREASLHGALFHLGLLERSRRAGAQVIARTEVRRIERQGSGFELHTSAGLVRAEVVVVATNGYTTGLTPDLARRLVPVSSFGIATEPLDKAVLDEVLPGRRPCVDTLKLTHGFRPAPGEERLIFGTRPPTRHRDLAHAAAHLRAEMVGVFPQLAPARITHVWSGHVAFPFELLPHTGVRNGVHYALGFCGYGVSLAPYLGHKLALRILGEEAGATVFSELSFPSRPFYRGRPWFLGPTLLYYRWKDKRAA